MVDNFISLKEKKKTLSKKAEKPQGGESGRDGEKPHPGSRHRVQMLCGQAVLRLEERRKGGATQDKFDVSRKVALKRKQKEEKLCFSE